MAKITLTGAAFHGFRFTMGPKRGEGAPIVIADFTAPWTERNRKAGDWAELPVTCSGTVNLLPASLAASNFEFIPGNGMEAHSISMDCSSVEEFKCFVPTKEGEARELRFVIKTPSIRACKDLEKHGRLAGDATGKLHISYDEETKPKQESLISKEQAADTMKTN